MTRWNLSIGDELDRDVRTFLARTGFKKGDLSAFVERACRNEVLRQTVTAIHARNADLSEEEAMRLANEEVAAVRATPS